MAGTTFVAHEDLSVTASAGLTSTTYAANSISPKVNYARVQVDGGSIRYRFTGTPTATSGALAKDGALIELESTDEVTSFKAISVTGSAVVLHAQYGSRGV